MAKLLGDLWEFRKPEFLAFFSLSRRGLWGFLYLSFSYSLPLRLRRQFSFAACSGVCLRSNFAVFASPRGFSQCSDLYASPLLFFPAFIVCLLSLFSSFYSFKSYPQFCMFGFQFCYGFWVTVSGWRVAFRAFLFEWVGYFPSIAMLTFLTTWPCFFRFPPVVGFPSDTFRFPFYLPDICNTLDYMSHFRVFTGPFLSGIVWALFTSYFVPI